MILSKLPCSANERLIIALDKMTIQQAKLLVEKLGEEVVVYKIGLEMFMSREYFDFLDWLVARDKKVFADLKLFDIPQTVAASIKQLAKTAATFVTVHGNEDILRAAVAEKGHLKILAVTALTSLDQQDINDLGFKVSIKDLVYSRAKRALEVGCDGIISSGLEVEDLKKEFPDNLLMITPGIRPVVNDDQKRVVSLEKAFYNGADYIVMGRPVYLAADPLTVVKGFQQQIKTVFS